MRKRERGAIDKEARIRRYWQLHEKAAGEALTITATGFMDIARASDLEVVRMEGQVVRAFALAISSGQALDHVAYQWCMTRFENFVYWDRAVVDVRHRRKGIGSDMFASLQSKAVAQQSETLLCQVHDRPANKAGHLFVQSLGFTPIESVMLPSREIITMYQRSIAMATP
jgi:predicted GNAT superfamily acetyltransferase